MISRIKETVEFMERTIMYRPKTGIILGSGLDDIENLLENKTIINYEDIPNFPVSTVDGHKGRFVVGKVDDVEVLLMEGRFHYYEGYSMDEITFPVYVLKYFGIRNLIVTNSAGGINEKYSVGDYMLINDHINNFGTSPLIGENYTEMGPRFLDMTQPYDTDLISMAKEKGKELGINCQEGVYIGVSGPCYETKAEIKYFGIIGADAVGMSTVPEVIAANYLGLRVLGISFISNMGTGISKSKHDHKNVLKAAQKNIKIFANWVKEIVLLIN